MNEIKFGDNKYCVPSVISSFTGITTDEAVVVIQSVLKTNREIRGVPVTRIPDCFNELGYSCRKIPHFGSTVFSALLSIKTDGMYMFHVGSPRSSSTHVIGIEIANGNRYLCDNRTKSPIKAAVSARLMQSLLDVFKVERMNKDE
jgi:hypothetical protein